jgi:hypothetical protein
LSIFSAALETLYACDGTGLNFEARVMELRVEDLEIVSKVNTIGCSISRIDPIFLLGCR